MGNLVVRTFLILALILLAAAGGRVLRAGVDYARDEKHVLLRPGVDMPPIPIEGEAGPTSLADAMAATNPNVLVVLSTRCTSALGELAGWRDAARGRSGIRAVVVIAEADAEYLSYVRQLLGPLDYELYSTASETLPDIGAAAVPVVYTLDRDFRVTHAAIGVKGTLEVRDDLVNRQAIR